METDHFLVFTQTYEEEGTYIVASSSLRDHPDYIRRMLLEAFHVTELLEDDGRKIVDLYDLQTEFPDEAGYLLILSPRSRFLWNGLVLMLEIPKIDLGLKDDRVRLIADGGQHRLALAKQEFAEGFLLGIKVFLHHCCDLPLFVKIGHGLHPFIGEGSNGIRIHMLLVGGLLFNGNQGDPQAQAEQN